MKKIRIKWCELAQRDHQKSKRLYAHTFHRDSNIICVCKELHHLPLEHKIAILTHEIGHLVIGEEGTEKDANRTIWDEFLVRIIYRQHTPWGNHLEYLNPWAAEFLFYKIIPLIHPSSLKWIEPSQ